MSIAYKENGVWKNVAGAAPVDSALSSTSKNAVQNKIVKEALDSSQTNIAKCEVLVVDIATFSSLPQTVTNSNIESDMVVVNSTLGSPSAQIDDWTVTTSDGSLTISGSISGSTTLTLYLMKSR